jgi:O-antigen/teichoic acid export membrane protein
MTNHKEDTKRLAKNTLFLYFRSLFSMAIGIYTSRVVLSTLGVIDYGIYTFVGGVVAIFQMFSATFVSATQRSISFEIGRKNVERTKQIFSAALNIHLVVAIAILFLMEIVGVWFINDKAHIPANRIVAANWVFQFSMAAFVVNFISIPYNALIIAKEKMRTFALVGIYESVIKLVIVYLLYITLFDHLIFYTILMFAVAVSVRIFYGIYCKAHFTEAKYKKTTERSIHLELLNLSGWIFLGSSASILTSQGINILINMFFQIAVNAAKGVASQVENVVTVLVNNFTMSLKPQITKSYSANEKEYLYKLIDQGSRMAFFLMSIMTVPIFILSDELLALWLKEVPPYTSAFLRLIMVYIMLQPLKTILDTLLLATGDIKKWQIVSGMIDILNVPVCYLIYKAGFPPYASYIVMIPISFLSLLNRIYFCHKKAAFSYAFYFKNIMLRSFASWVTPILMLYYLKAFVPSGFIYFLIMGFTCVLCTMISIALFGLNKSELTMIKVKAFSYTANFINRKK